MPGECSADSRALSRLLQKLNSVYPGTAGRADRPNHGACAFSEGSGHSRATCVPRIKPRPLDSQPSARVFLSFWSSQLRLSLDLAGKQALHCGKFSLGQRAAPIPTAGMAVRQNGLWDPSTNRLLREAQVGARL